MQEYASATKGLQMAQTLQQQVPAWMAMPVKPVDLNFGEKTNEAATCPADFVPEKPDPRLQQQWRQDEASINKYKAAQKEQEVIDLEKKMDTDKKDDYPKPKAMPIRLESIGSMEVAAGTLEFFARLTPAKKKQTVPEDGEAKASSAATVPEGKPPPPSTPPPHLKNINAPPPAVPVWRDDGGKKSFVSVQYRTMYSARLWDHRII